MLAPVEGNTAADDLIDASYGEPVEFGSDRVDSNDAPGGGDAEVIGAGAGNDTVVSGAGVDSLLRERLIGHAA